jgi:hypothetical protein
VNELPQAFGTAAGQGAIFPNRAPERHDILGRIVAGDATPPSVGLPLGFELGGGLDLVSGTGGHDFSFELVVIRLSGHSGTFLRETLVEICLFFYFHEEPAV